HDAPPKTGVLTGPARRGARLFRRNCAFCHAVDGSGRNWIGAFLEPHPRNLADRDFTSATTRRRLAAVIRDGLPGTSMPAWKSVFGEEDVQAIVAYLSAAFGPIDP
ncbi:MAG: cytochrome c, partial [Burkholderiales bacterium]